MSTLQAGRAVAALAVVAYHAALYSGVEAFSLGYLGVDFFFVLSGFIICWATGERQRPRDFLAARLTRIFLPYLPIAIAVAMIAVAAPSLKGAGEWSWLTTLTLVPFGADSALGVAWSLRHELVFYALFGLAMWGGRRWLLAVLWPVAIVAAASLGVADRFVLAPINFEFVFGMLAAMAVTRTGLRTSWFVILGMVALACCAVIASDETPFRIAFGLAVAAFLVPVVRGELYRGWRAPGLLVAIGNASYSIYLVHNPVVTLAAKPGAEIGFILALACGIAAGLLYHRAIEAPALRAVRGRRLRRGRWQPSA